MPSEKKPKPTYEEQQAASLRARIDTLQDKCAEEQKSKTEEILASVDTACEKIAKRYRERIAVLSKQLGALTGK